MDYSKLMLGKSDKAGAVEFTVTSNNIFNKGTKEVTLFYNIVEESRFKLFRNNKFELVLLHVTEDWMRQAKIDISKYSEPLDIKITWDANVDTLAVKGTGETEYQTVQAMQIDN